MQRCVCICFVATLVVALAVPVAANAELRRRFDERLEAVHDELIEVRRDIHRHPEISGEEKRTSRLVVKRLKSLGFEVRSGVGGYGVVAVLAGGAPGHVVAFRADMDAVPSTAPDPVAFKSENAGVRHICGHDIHTTIGLALAEGLAAVREDLAGSVMLVFQPAEENATGARAMLADGALKPLTPDAFFAFHTAPMPVGQLITAPNALMAWRDRVHVTLSGDGDLAAAARKLSDAFADVGTVPAAQGGAPQSGDFAWVQALGPSKAGSGEWTVGAVVSTATDAAGDTARRKIEALVADIRSDDVTATLDYEQKWVAGVTNDPGLTERAIASARSVLGVEAVGTTSIVIPAFSEDFGSFQQVVPGVMFFIGVSNPEKGWVGMPHSPEYVADEASIFVGARSMAAILLDFLDDYGRRKGTALP